MNNHDIRTRGNKFTIFSYILSCKIRRREFIDRNIFYVSEEDSKIKKEKRRHFHQGT